MAGVIPVNRRIPIRMLGFWHSMCDMLIYEGSGLPVYRTFSTLGSSAREYLGYKSTEV